MSNLLSEQCTSGRSDLQNLPEFQQQRPDIEGSETVLYQIDGTNIVQWHYRTLKSVYWIPAGEYMVIKHKETA